LGGFQLEFELLNALVVGGRHVDALRSFRLQIRLFLFLFIPLDSLFTCTLNPPNIPLHNNRHGPNNLARIPQPPILFLHLLAHNLMRLDNPGQGISPLHTLNKLIRNFADEDTLVGELLAQALQLFLLELLALLELFHHDAWRDCVLAALKFYPVWLAR
jgi:hypothetical protein